MNLSSLVYSLVSQYIDDGDYYRAIEKLKQSGVDGKDLWYLLESIEPIGIRRIKGDLGTIIQKSLNPSQRKILAANYTTLESVSFVISLAPKNAKYIADPFCGSGRLIIEYLKRCSTKFPHVYINDILPEAIVVAFFSIYKLFKERGEDLRKLHVSIGDGFLWNPEHKIDLFITNPPFTRVHNLSETQKKTILKFGTDFQLDLFGQPGLHIYALLKMHSVISSNGTIVSVLPTTTISSNYSREYQKFLLDNYHNINFFIPTNMKGFSDDSQFRELVMSAKYGAKSEIVTFSKVSNDLQWTVLFSNRIPKKILDRLNWTLYFHSPELLNLHKLITKSESIKTPKELGLKIKRGVEMYGPDFFLLPNKMWEIIEDDLEYLTIRNSIEYTLKIPKKNLQKILRKPSLYKGQAIPDCNEYALNLDDDPPEWFNLYLEVTHAYAEVSKRKFGEKWYSHIRRQLLTKKPFAHLFLADKFGISTISNMCFYSEETLACTKNFYFFDQLNRVESKFLASWLNSSIYLFLFLMNRREIGGSYGRMQISDLMNTPLIIDLTKITGHSELLQEFDNFTKEFLPPIPDQLKNSTKAGLDHIFFDILGLPDLSEILVKALDYLLKDIVKRDINSPNPKT